jgi:hypothetical protein
MFLFPVSALDFLFSVDLDFIFLTAGPAQDFIPA